MNGIVNLALPRTGAHGHGRPAVGENFGGGSEVRRTSKDCAANGFPVRPKPVITSSNISRFILVADLP